MKLVAAAFCPHPPLLVPEVARDEPVAVRAPALAATRWLVEQPVEQVLVLGSADVSARFEAGSVGSFAGYGVARAAGLPGELRAASALLPLPLTVGAWLLEQVGWTRATFGLVTGEMGDLPDLSNVPDVATGLLVMGDGSARRSEKAPGWLDERGQDYDAGVSAALAAGHPADLAPDLALGAELLAAGAPAWSAAGVLLAGSQWDAQVTYDDAPYGVGYLVATWSPSSTR